MVRDNQASLGTAFTVSIEARHGVSTGISARDRATTIRAAIADDAGPSKIVSPGHMFPLRARKGGVLVRTGQTEGSVDLARLAGLKPAGVICEIMREDGEMARLPELEEFARSTALILLSVADMIAYRLERERIVHCEGSARCDPARSDPGEPFAAHYYCVRGRGHRVPRARARRRRGRVGGKGETVLVRVAALDPLADPFDLRPDLVHALEAIDQCRARRPALRRQPPSHAARRLVRAARHAARGRAPELRGQRQNSEALRDFGLGAQVLADLGCHKIRLMMWSDRKIPGLEGFGIDVVERVPIAPMRARWPGQAPRNKTAG